jgi:hypothetical protein
VHIIAIDQGAEPFDKVEYSCFKTAGIIAL